MSGLIARPFIDELLQQTNIVELIDSYVPLQKKGSSYIACCPFHQEKTPSFNVVAKKQFYHCFGCGASGNAISFIMQYLNQGFATAVETLAARLGLQIPREKSSKSQQRSLSLYQLLAEVSQFYQKNLKTQGQPAIAYLRQRGVNGEIAKQYELGYAPPGWHILARQFKNNITELIHTGMLIQKDNKETYDRYRHRITFPIHDRHGRLIGFGGRAIDSDQKPKYLNSPETSIFQKSRELYGLHQLLQRNHDIDSIVVVEGYLDVIALAQHDIINAVATLGTATSVYHIQLLSKHTKQLIFCFDGDNAGRQAAWRALESCLPELHLGLDVRFAFLPDSHDPDSFVRQNGREAFLTYLEQAIPLNQFFFETLTTSIDIQSVAGKSQLLHAAKPFFAKMQESPYKQLLTEALARCTHIENHRIQQLLNTTHPDKIQDNPKTINRTPIRLAIALLLQHPEIYNQCKDQITLEALEREEYMLLKTLIQHLTLKPDATTASMLELWRDTMYFEPMCQLAAWNHQVPEQVLAKEFIDIMAFLQKQEIENKIQYYLTKLKQEGLSSSERLALQTMLRQRHQVPQD